jgi:hypothetical protein
MTSFVKSCEQFFSKMKVVKSKSINQLGNRKLESCQIASSHTHSNIKNMVARKQ